MRRKTFIRKHKRRHVIRLYSIDLDTLNITGVYWAICPGMNRKLKQLDRYLEQKRCGHQIKR